MAFISMKQSSWILLPRSVQKRAVTIDGAVSIGVFPQLSISVTNAFVV
jgi:hypothetical protein